MHQKEENLTKNHITPMVSEIYTIESTKKTQVSSWIAFCRETKKKVRETSRLRNLNIINRNPQRNCTFMNSISVFPFHSQLRFVSNNLINLDILIIKSIYEISLVSSKTFPYKFLTDKAWCFKLVWQVLLAGSTYKVYKKEENSDIICIWSDICLLLFLKLILWAGGIGGGKKSSLINL